MYKMQAEPNLLSLPDLVLHHICTSIDCPVDLLNFGNTCTKLYKLASSRNVWWHATLHWCKGLWPWIDRMPDHRHPRQWLLELIKHYTTPPPETDLTCSFEGERWRRADTQKFRCLVGMLRVAYGDQQKGYHPGVLFKRWLLDIGLFHRISSNINFAAEDFKFSEDSSLRLSILGQAKDRDLRARKQPYLDPMYYVKRVSVARENWCAELFPSGPNGSICPLLICPFEDSFCSEVSGISGLTMCLSLVLEEHLRCHCLSNGVSPSEMLNMIKMACDSFCQNLTLILPQIKEIWGPYCLKDAMKDMATHGIFTLESWQNDLNQLKIHLNWKIIISGLSDLLEKHGGIDAVVDNVRLRWRRALVEEINSIIFANDGDLLKPVTRVNITDSDLIGGDNHRQEMSAAAFISDSGVLVTWHLTGRLRY